MVYNHQSTIAGTGTPQFVASGSIRHFENQSMNGFQNSSNYDNAVRAYGNPMASLRNFQEAIARQTESHVRHRGIINGYMDEMLHLIMSNQNVFAEYLNFATGVAQHQTYIQGIVFEVSIEQAIDRVFLGFSAQHAIRNQHDQRWNQVDAGFMQSINASQQMFANWRAAIDELNIAVKQGSFNQNQNQMNGSYGSFGSPVTNPNGGTTMSFSNGNATTKSFSNHSMVQTAEPELSWEERNSRVAGEDYSDVDNAVKHPDPEHPNNKSYYTLEEYNAAMAQWEQNNANTVVIQEPVHQKIVIIESSETGHVLYEGVQLTQEYITNEADIAVLGSISDEYIANHMTQHERLALFNRLRAAMVSAKENLPTDKLFELRRMLKSRYADIYLKDLGFISVAENDELDRQAAETKQRLEQKRAEAQVQSNVQSAIQVVTEDPMNYHSNVSQPTNQFPMEFEDEPLVTRGNRKADHSQPAPQAFVDDHFNAEMGMASTSAVGSGNGMNSFLDDIYGKELRRNRQAASVESQDVSPLDQTDDKHIAEVYGEGVEVGAQTYSTRANVANTMNFEKIGTELDQAILDDTQALLDAADQAKAEMANTNREAIAQALVDFNTLTKEEKVRAIADRKVKACPVYNYKYQKLSFIRAKDSGEIVVEEITMNYEDHEHNVLFNPRSRLDVGAGSDLEFGRETLKRAAEFRGEAFFQEKLEKLRSEEKDVEDLLATSPTIWIDDYIKNDNQHEYHSDATLEITSRCGNDIDTSLDGAVINYNRMLGSGYLLEEKGIEQAREICRGTKSQHIVKAMIKFFDNTTLPNREANRLHEEATNMLNHYLRSHVHPHLSVDSVTNDYEELMGHLMTGYVHVEYLSTKIDTIYMLVAKDIFTAHTYKTLSQHTTDPDMFGLVDSEDEHAITASLENVTLIPCSIRDIPLAFSGDYGEVTKETHPELYELMAQATKLNPTITKFKIVTDDNAVINYFKAVTGDDTIEPAFIIIR